MNESKLVNASKELVKATEKLVIKTDELKCKAKAQAESISESASVQEVKAFLVKVKTAIEILSK